MNVEALKELRRVIQAVPVGQLDMNVWRSRCGTFACAAGWMAQDAWFVNMGWGVHSWGGLTFDGEDMTYHESFETLKRFFGINLSDAAHLFDPNHYEDDVCNMHDGTDDYLVPNAVVVARIDALLEGRS